MATEKIKLKDGSFGLLTKSTLKPGDGGVYQTLGIMEQFVLRDMSNPEIMQIARRLKGASDIETAKKVFQHVVNNYPYVSDPTWSEFVTAPIHLIKKVSPYKYLDCDDLSVIVAAFLKALGYRVKFRVIAWRKHDYTHVYCLAYLPEENAWIPLDAVLRSKGVGNERAPIIRRYDYEIGSKTLNDGGLADDNARYATDWLTKVLLGKKNAGSATEEVMTEICMDGFNKKISDNMPKIVVGSLLVAGAFTAIGVVIGKNMKRGKK